MLKGEGATYQEIATQGGNFDGGAPTEKVPSVDGFPKDKSN